MMTKVRLGGVPEHFNMPWHYALENDLFKKSDIELEWSDYPGGTGAMANALKSNEIDIALMLTEGAIADIEKGANNTILGFYVKTPLLWGIHVLSGSGLAEDEIFTQRYAISRKGSGSHLMALVHASINGHSIDENQLVIVNNLEGAIRSLTQNESEIFFWEKFMTSKLLEKGIFKRIGEFPTPWPCFVLVVKDTFLTQHRTEIEQIVTIIERVNTGFKQIPHLIIRIAEKYNLSQNQVDAWLKTVEWADEVKIDSEEISNVKRMLIENGII